MPKAQRLPALAHRDFRRYLLGSFVSNIGNTIQAATIAWHVWVLTGDSLMVGLLGAVRVGPLLLFSLFGGVIADQHDRRKVMLITQGSMAIVALALTLASSEGRVTVGLLYLLVALFSVARAFDGPSRQALVANLVPERALPNAISFTGITWRASDVLGPVVAGSIIALGGFPSLGGFGTCYLLNCLSYVALLFAVWRMPPMPPVGHTKERLRSVSQVVGFIKEGLDFVRRTPVVRSAMWIDFWATLFSSADALLPAFAAKLLKTNAFGYGLLGASIAIGALIGAMFMVWIPTPRDQGRWVISMIALYGLCTVLFGFSPNLTLAAIFLAGTGFADMISTVLRQTIRQLATPDRMRGRMTATSMLFHISGPQLGDFESGALARLTGERWSIAIGGFACMLVSAHWWRGTALREYEHDPPRDDLLPAAEVARTSTP